MESKQQHTPASLPSLQSTPNPNRIGPHQALERFLLAMARPILRNVLEAEFEDFYEQHAHLQADGRQRVVRNGFVPSRRVSIGIGSVGISMPRVRDRGDAQRHSSIKFNSRIVPPYLRRTSHVQELLPYALLQARTTGNFKTALLALLGPKSHWPPDSIRKRLLTRLEEQRKHWRALDASRTPAACLWAISFDLDVRGLPPHVARQADLQFTRQTFLTLLGADHGSSHPNRLLALGEGEAASNQSWQELLRNVRSLGMQDWSRDLQANPTSAIWQALDNLGWI